MRKILLVGGAGFIGTQLCRDLLDRKYEVTVVDLLWFGNHLSKEIKLIKQDARELDPKDITGYDALIFLGGLSNDPMANFNPSMNFVHNAAVPTYLAFIAKQAGIPRFVYAGSCSVYGYTSNKLMTEEDPVGPNFPYGISKILGEQAVFSLEDENFRPISLRKGTVGGWSPRMRYDLVVNAMTKTAISEGKIIVNNPSIWRPLIDIRDACKAYIRAIEANLEITGVFNICYDNFTIGRLAEEIKDELKIHGIETELIIKDIQDVRNYKVTNDKARTVLDFVPRYHPARDSVREILKNIDQENYDFKKKDYYNIAVFEEQFG